MQSYPAHGLCYDLIYLHFSYLIIKSLQKYIKSTTTSNQQSSGSVSEIGNWLVENEPAVNRYNVIKGFLNIVIEPTYWNAVLSHIIDTPHYGTTEPTTDSPLVMVHRSFRMP